VRDGYTLKIANRSFYPKTLAVRFSGVDGARLKAPGAPPTAGDLLVTVDPNAVRSARIFVTVPQGASAGPVPAAFTVGDGRDRARAKTVFDSGAAP